MKMHSRSTRVVAGLWMFVALSSLAADDWPQWRGPGRDGKSAETGLLRKWPEDGPKLLWRVDDAGGGYSTPSVVGDRLYLLGSSGNDNEFVQARKVADGSVVWSKRIGAVGNPDQRPSYPGARSTPTVDGDVLYALGSDGDLVCLALGDGEVHWKKNLRADFDGEPGEWAYAESPLIDGDVLVCTPGGAGATVVGLDKKSGDVVWKTVTPEHDEAAYASPIIAEAAGVKQYIQFLEKGVVGIDARTGDLLWRYGKTAEGSPANIPTPIAHEGYIYSATGRGGAALVKIVSEGDAYEAKPVYHADKLPTSIGGAVRLGDVLYGTTGQGLLCVDFDTGDVKWQNRSIGAASLCYADGLLFLHGENGDVALVEASPEEYRERGRFTPPDPPDRGRSKAWAYPVIADGRLYVRDLNVLWCFDVRAEKESAGAR